MNERKYIMFHNTNPFYEFSESYETYPGWYELKDIDFKLKSLIEDYNDARKELDAVRKQIDDIISDYL